MKPRVTSALEVSALLRRVNAAGGFATVVKKGDETSGSIILILAEKGNITSVHERMLTSNDNYSWRGLFTQNIDNIQELHSGIERLKQRDPDLWIVELDIAHPERFIADSPSFD